jgi:hypothetical protein
MVRRHNGRVGQSVLKSNPDIGVIVENYRAINHELSQARYNN